MGTDGAAAEYLASLQAQIDRLMDRNEALERRVQHLERDRSVLRAKLNASRRWRRAADSAPQEQPQPPDHSIDIPDVGVIPDLRLELPAPSRRDLVVATVLDPFSYAAFAPEFNCVQLAPGDLSTLEDAHPDLLLVESAYQGLEGRWASRVARFGQPHPDLRAAVDWCREHGVPAVFWNKEDPINYDWFVASASLFDHVFTVDSNSVPRYRQDLGHDRIHVLPFAAQPAIHHPPEDERSRTGSIAFAGSYYAAKHAARRAQMDMLLDPARQFGLHIFDRFAGTSDERFAWPARFVPHVIGSLTYPQTLEVYRRYRIFLNVNTVTDSPTMCARRIFELLASGAAVVSGPSRALSELLEPGIVRIVDSPDAARAAIAELLSDDSVRLAATAAGLRWIAESGNTMSDRVESMLGTLP